MKCDRWKQIHFLLLTQERDRGTEPLPPEECTVRRLLYVYVSVLIELDKSSNISFLRLMIDHCSCASLYELRVARWRANYTVETALDRCNHSVTDRPTRVAVY